MCPSCQHVAGRLNYEIGLRLPLHLRYKVQKGDTRYDTLIRNYFIFVTSTKITLKVLLNLLGLVIVTY